MIENIEIRLAVIEDLPALVTVGDNLFDHPVKPHRATEFLEDGRHHLVLAFYGSEVVGMASGFHYVHPDKDPELFINEVGVVESFQNQGIGRKLVKYLWEYAKKLGCVYAWVGTEKSNITAQKCYLAAGAELDEEPFLLFEFNNEDG
ncbi:GNAT family N-acetyltransferase [Maribacter halichondriae]|uniref:GNAT family N-acetyltransferase n=1 Tax=Maribacter halichondriae TaxID=2980554 RepID=UPI00235A29CC|nr:GNAT family N-acetyltransferase [Maribacter sp. Hal144]